MKYCRYNLEGKTAVIADSSRGIYKATALHLAEKGVNVVISYLNREKCEEARA